MARPDEPIRDVLVETYEAGSMSGRHGRLHVRPVAGQGLDTDLAVESNREMRELYPPKSLFIVRAKLSDREGGRPYLKSPYPREYSPVDLATAKRFLKSLK